VNIGNARLYHLEEDLGLTGNQFQVAVSILFVTYILFEVPSNLVLKLFTPRRWIAFITTSWGIIATLTGLVHNYPSLIACRLLLGVVEAGLFPGLNVYLTFFYTKHELALRVGYLFVSAAIAGGLGGLLAFGIGQMDGVAGMHGWRWIMIIEGLPSIVLGILTFFLLPNDAGSAYFLSENERKMMVARHKVEYGNTTSAQEFSRRDMMKAFKDWKVWLFCVAQFGSDTMLYGKWIPHSRLGGEWLLTHLRIFDIPTDDCQWSRQVDAGPSTATDRALLFPRRRHVHGDSLPVRPVSEARAVLRHIWDRLSCWIRDTYLALVAGRSLLRVGCSAVGLMALG
jgi:MFS family permease